MRASSVTLGAILVGGILLSGTASDAAARGRRSPGVVFVPTATGSIGSAAAGRSVREEPAASLAMPRPILPVAAPVGPAPVRDARAAQAWCGSGRVVGSGAGFCEIN